MDIDTSIYYYLKQVSEILVLDSRAYILLQKPVLIAYSAIFEEDTRL